ncbi:MAG TPA: hypothetical protein VFP72_17895 [Kineosporiaceae bacterium]|nr:hypothetical protein [Kineosporiaceae bacterium]
MADDPRPPGAAIRYEVIHVERAFSAQPTLGDALGLEATVLELPLPELLACEPHPDLIWISDATEDAVHLVRERFPTVLLLATVPRTTGPKPVLALMEAGADLVLRDEGILLAAAALQAMARRRPPPLTVDRELTSPGV